MLSFLHAADLHLGLRITRFEEQYARRIREARFRSLDNILKKIPELSADFLLIAGDLFDDHAVDGTTARRAFEMLESASCPVFVISGNHDPLIPGAVWDRDPWKGSATKRVRLLRERRPESIAPGITLLPCPLRRKTDMQDPTQWMTAAAADGAMRIGMAHGSLKVRDDLAPDDHLIDRDAARRAELDYLALGHWHRQIDFRDRDGVVRTAYSGVHEPMRFPGVSEEITGWTPYAQNARADVFEDAGLGSVLHVKIERPGAAPQVQPIDVAYLRWQNEAHRFNTDEDLHQLIAEISQRSLPERRLLRLTLSGVLSAEGMQRLDELETVLLGNFAFGILEKHDVHLQPTAEELRQAVDQGICGRMAEKLTALRTQPGQAELAERALLLLYQLMRETAA